MSNQDGRKRSPTKRPSNVRIVLNGIQEEKELHKLIHRMAFDLTEIEVISKFIETFREARA